MSQEELREFRGYMNGILVDTFPLHCVCHIKVKDDVMIVSYYDEMQYNTLVEIRVDEIDIK